MKHLITVDSLLLRLPLNPQLITINPNSGLTDNHLLVNTNTGEAVTYDKPSKPTKIVQDGITYDFNIRNKNIKGITTPYLYIKVMAKMLKYKYLEGITLDNVNLIYNDIINCNVADFSYDTFLNRSYCTDIDLKQDRVINKTDYSNVLKQLRELTPENKQSKKGYENTNGGILWHPKRRGATITTPHIQIYDKEKELINNSTEFYNMYLSGKDIKDLKRFEFTVKGAEHLQHLGVTATSLQAILNISQPHLITMKKNVMGRAIKIDKPIQDKKNTKLTAADKVVFNAITQFLKTTKNYYNILNQLSADLEYKTKSRFIKKWENRKDLFNDKFDKKTTQNNLIYEWLNMGFSNHKKTT